MRTRVNHFIGNKLRLLHLNCYSKCCFSIFILFSFGFTVDFFCYTQICISTVFKMRHSGFSHGDCVMHRVTQLGSILK